MLAPRGIHEKRSGPDLRQPGEELLVEPLLWLVYEHRQDVRDQVLCANAAKRGEADADKTDELNKGETLAPGLEDVA